MKKLLEKVRGLWTKFKSQNKKIKIAVIAAVIAIIIAIASAIFYSSYNKYELLFADLSDENLQTVVTTLKSENVDTQIDGNTIKVPKDQVYKLRLELTPLLTTQSKGFELMDSTSSFGMTDDQFKIKKVQMQQGQIENTIKGFSQVQDAKVNITEATESVFAKDKQEGKAAVYVKLKKGQTLSEDQVKTIVALVSGSIQNVPKKNVDVMDQDANLLTKDINNDDNSSVSSEEMSKQQQAKKAKEDELKKKIISLLESIVGKGKVNADVNVDLDFDSKQITQTVVDPNKVIVSQENNKETNTSGTGGTTSQSPVDNNMSNTITNTNGDKNTSAKENQKTNYEVGKSESKVISSPGGVKRITAAVFVGGTLDDAAVQQIKESVGNAIGIDANRGDSISVVNTTFDTTAQDEAKAQFDAMNSATDASNSNKYMIIAGILGTLILGLIIFLIAKRRKKKKAENEQLLDTLIDDSIIPKEPESFDPIEFEAKTKKSHLEDEIKKYATEKPEQVVDIIRSWLAENER